MPTALRHFLVVVGALATADALQYAARRTPSQRCASPLMAAGPLLRATHCVDDVESVVRFYTTALGLSSSKSLPDDRVVLSGEHGMGLELRHVKGGAYQARGGYRGMSLRVPSVSSALEAVQACGGTVLSELDTVEHGASQQPDEPDETLNAIVEAVVADPCGYPVLLHEVEGTETAFSGVRCDVYEWKASQEWWEGLGWRTLRWQSNVVREASLTVTMGAADSPTPVGPRGGDEAVVQLTYNYGSAPIVHQESGGFEGLVVGAGDEDAREMRDPDEYTVTLV